jgi:MoaA/NifB/PqqE/SkfB family radical SAM enzyme
MNSTDSPALSSHLPHIVAAQKRLENLWAAGTDYSVDIVSDARNHNRMLHLDLDLTGECKLNCFYCDRTPDRYNEVPNRIELTTAQRLGVIQQAHALGATTVEFPGAGEPMIDPGFWDVFEYIHELGMIPVLFTSGFHLDRDALKRLYALGATIFLKHNSDDLTVQDKMVGLPGYGQRASDALRMMLEMGFNSTVPTRMAIDMVVTPQFNESDNFSEVVSIHRWCRQNNVHNYIVTLIPEGRADRSAMLLERERANRMLDAVRRVDEQEFGLSYKPIRPMAGGYRCRQVNVGLFVNLFGEVYDCNGLGRLLGHLRINSLEEIWNSKFAKHVRGPLQDGFCALRERFWDTDSKGMQRKIDDYRRFEKIHGEDPVVTRAIDRVHSTSRNGAELFPIIS